MDKDIAIEWATALRSGQYKQSRYALHLTDGGYCCLGVLCLVRNIPIPELERDAYNAIRNLLTQGEVSQFIQFNDGLKLTFSQIADKIEDLYIKGDPSE